MGLIGRLHRLADVLHAELRPVFAEAGLGPTATSTSSPRCAGPARRTQLTPSELGRVDHGHVGGGHQADRPARGDGLVTRTVCETTPAHAGSGSPRTGLALVDELMGEAPRQRAAAAWPGSPTSSAPELAHLLEAWGQSLDV